MKTILALTVAVIMMGVGAPSSPQALETRSASELERERRHDEQMWQLMCLMLMEFGYSNKVAALDNAWQKTMTPQQWAALDWPKPTAVSPSPAAQRVAARCAAVTNTDFAVVFQSACRETNDAHAVVMGLLAWTQNGGHPSLQGRSDLALHFIYAAAAELAGLGRAAAVIKEQLDQSHGKPFDLDDLAAGFAGAQWVQQARLSPQWLQQWASGKKTLHKNLPSFQYGIALHSPQVLERIQQDIQTAFIRESLVTPQ